jgi:phage-related baseplate assembly protein
VFDSGGGDGDTIDEIRQNSLSNYNTQQRNVTADDYLIRALSMPSKFGVIAKAFTAKSSPKDPDTILDLYILTQDINSNLTKSSETIKQNLTTYLNQYRMIGDTVNIKDAFIVNIGVEFDIITLPNFNNHEILTNCITALQRYFDINKWQINQPIILRDLTILLDAIDGVQTVADIQIINKAGTNSGYSEYAYSISSATQGGVIYPSLDPSIFEVKFPSDDIKGRVVSLGTGTFGYGGY